MSIPPVLLISADARVAEEIRQGLVARGYRVQVACDAAEGMICLNDQPIGLIVCDSEIPRFGGVDLLHELVAEAPGRPIVMLVPAGDLTGVVECMRGGAIDCLPKPVDLERLLQVVDAALVSRVHETIYMDRPGKEIAGFEVVCKIGDGSMGVVYLARRDGRRYALKVLRVPVDDPAEVAEMRERFLREATLTARIRHPNIVEIVSHGVEAETGRPYIVMELLNGISLADLPRRRPGLSCRESVTVLRQVAAGLAAIHRHQICHRDVKPTNILVDDQLHATLMDLGIAKIPGSDLTRSDEMLGSPAYMAPESFGGDLLTPGADVFSLGSCAYELLVGFRPFEGSGIAAIAEAICNVRPPEPRQVMADIPAFVQQVLGRMLDKDPATRYPSAAEVEADLGRYLDGKGVVDEAEMARQKEEVWGPAREVNPGRRT